MQLPEIGQLVQSRRSQLGLSQQQLARLSGLSRATVNQLERGTLKDLGVAKLIGLVSLLGIELSARAGPPNSNGLHMAAITSGVSLRKQLSPAMLAQAMRSGRIPPGYEAQVAALLDEAPLEIVVKAVEESAGSGPTGPKKIWAHLSRWAGELQSTRPVWLP